MMRYINIVTINIVMGIIIIIIIIIQCFDTWLGDRKRDVQVVNKTVLAEVFPLTLFGSCMGKGWP